MGLKSYREYKRHQEFISLLAEFGLSVDDLRYIKELRADADKVAELSKALIESKAQIEVLQKEVAELKASQTKVSQLTKDEEAKIKEKYQDGKYTTPQDIVDMFAGDNEEFYPNGIGN